MRISPALKTMWSWGWMLSCQAATHCWVGAVKPSVSEQTSRVLFSHLPPTKRFFVLFFFWGGWGEEDGRVGETTKYFPKYPLDVSVLCLFKCPRLLLQSPLFSLVPASIHQRSWVPIAGPGPRAGGLEDAPELSSPVTKFLRFSRKEIWAVVLAPSGISSWVCQIDGCVKTSWCLGMAESHRCTSLPKEMGLKC